MLHLRIIITRFTALNAALLLVLGLAIPVFVSPQKARADNLLVSRSLNLASSAMGNINTDFHGTAVNPGEGGNGQKTKHTIKFTMATSGATVGSITIMYCTSPILQNTCTTPTGLDATHVGSVTVAATSGAIAGGANGGFTLDAATTNNLLSPSANGLCKNLAGNSTTDTERANCVALKRVGGALAETGAPGISITYGGGSSDYITNPIVSQANNLESYTFYARIQIFGTTSYTTLVDYGGTAASTAQQIDILTKVQEILNFSVGVLPLLNSGTACTPLGSQTGGDTGYIEIGDGNSVLSTLQAYQNHSYFRVNSNTVNGTKIYYSGYTLTSGSNKITAMGTPQPGPPTTAASSSPGSKQFGLSIDSSDTQLQGGQPAGYSFVDMSATPPYGGGAGTITSGGTATFAFTEASITSPVEVANSTGGVACDTGSIRYIANVSTSTPAGIYTTTITYIATGTY